MSHKILIIGCGNIGAGYDFESDYVQTHAKAFFLHQAFQITFFDLDTELAQRVAGRYRSEFLTDIDQVNFSDFDCVSICTPTTTHARFLTRAFESEVPLVICEKPVASEVDDLIGLIETYHRSNTKVIVNYMRRFLPCFAELRKYISQVQKDESLTNVSVRYQRGFVNNAGHALDLVQYLLSDEIKLTDITTFNRVFDAFPNDPTMSLQAIWNKANINVTGLANVKFSCFEIDLFFEYHRIQIKEAGNTIEVLKAEKGGEYFKPLLVEKNKSRHNCLENYMKPVAQLAADILNGEHKEDNFEEAAYLNIRMLNYIKP
ncbi:MAG: Gfo/Idh/MocA family oxidoreductase [Roseivirga sp.]|nr:Gfo/Idh/MocA family oxidoreductase [Roseivirga sp.]